MMMFALTLFTGLCVDPFKLEPNSWEVLGWQGFLEIERADQTRDALSRAEPWIAQFRAIFSANGVPADLAWIPLIESSFRSEATSPSGAQGMFQFKAKTARYLGLRIDRIVDERNHPLRAAEAAAAYLVYLRNRFSSWELVLAAYNLGEGDLRRLMQAKQIDRWSILKEHVRPETRAYVEKIKAAAIIGNAHLAKIPNRPAISPVYRVKPGDTIYGIARRFKVPVSELMKSNGLNQPLIKPGQELILPPTLPTNQ